LVVDFAPTTTNTTSTSTTAAIVNAANTGCLGGGGVDGAIAEAGGENLARDRLALPIIGIEDNDNDNIRCFPGSAVITPNSPNNSDNNDDDDKCDIRCLVGSAVIAGNSNNNDNGYGELHVPFVIHAVGPAYSDYKTLNEGHALLKLAYKCSLDLAAANNITEIAFSLLSAGVYRGKCPRSKVLSIAVESITEWCLSNNNINNTNTNNNAQSINSSNGDDSNNNNSPCDAIQK
jgi:O-acetyl-ADP-ribose deacetylase (regulator of RNase III)